MLSVAEAGRGQLSIFGDDYPTSDGTCVRDYIHVHDLAIAHILALGACESGQHLVYNLGSGLGYSNRQVLDTCQAVTGADIATRVADRRPGDPAVLIASSDRISAELGWQPERSLRDMIADAWVFTKQASRG